MKKIIQTFISLLFIFLAMVQISNAQTKPGYKLPSYEKFKLPNGLTVYLMEKHDIPVVSIDVILSAGSIYDGNKAGLAAITAECLRTGTKNYTQKQIDEQLDFTGSSLNTFSATEYADLKAKFAVKDEDKILPIIKELLVNAIFPDSEFVKIRKRTLSELDQAKETPSSVIGAYWNKFFYGNHVDGNVASGTVTSVSSLTSDDAKNFYKSFYSPSNSAIALAGDFNTREMKAVITKLFTDWKAPATTPNNSSAQTVNAPTSARVLLVNKDDSKETTFIIGSTGISRSNPDYLAIHVVNTFFGGKFTSMLNQQLRIKTGLTYGAYSVFDYNKNNGTFYIGTHTANETTKAAIDTALSVLNHLHAVPLDPVTLASAKNYMIGLFPPKYQTTDELSSLMTEMFLYNFNESYINKFEENVNAVTLDKANEIIAKYFPKGKLQFVLIGKSAEIKKIAEGYGPVKEVQLKDDIGKGF